MRTIIEAIALIAGLGMTGGALRRAAAGLATQEAADQDLCDAIFSGS